jgi:hypothetical protein
VGYFLSLLPLLACPIGMGLMMLFMGRMNHGGHAGGHVAAGNTSSIADAPRYAPHPDGLEEEATTLARRRVTIMSELRSIGETPEPAARPSCCGSGRVPREAGMMGGKR